MNIWRVEVNATRTRYNERSTHLVAARTAEQAIQKACRQAKQDGAYKAYGATGVELIGDAL